MNLDHINLTSHQEYASGAGLPGPGKISLSCVSTSLLSSTSVMRRESSSCSSVLGPMIGAVTAGFVNSHAKATTSSFSPSSRHNAPNRSSCSRCCSSFSVERALRAPVPAKALRPSKPPDNGLQGMTPSPSACAAGSTSSSAERCSRLYRCCSETSPRKCLALKLCLRYRNMPTSKVTRADVIHGSLLYKALEHTPQLVPRDVAVNMVHLI